MIGVRFNARDLVSTLTNTVNYSKGFLNEVKRSEPKLAQKVADMSIDVFYDYLDGLARSHPGMLHHVYEWGQIGDPFGRLYQLQRNMLGNTGSIRADFLESTTTSSNSSEPFYDKATIMEEGSPVVVTEKDAQVLFFEIDGEEFFRHGPIFIANPGGSATRGSFVRAFNEFYTSYFSQVYLRSIRFYDHFNTPKDFLKNFRQASKSTSASNLGRAAALSWILTSPGDKI